MEQDNDLIMIIHHINKMKALVAINEKRMQLHLSVIEHYRRQSFMALYLLMKPRIQRRIWNLVKTVFYFEYYTKQY